MNKSLIALIVVSLLFCVVAAVFIALYIHEKNTSVTTVNDLSVNELVSAVDTKEEDFAKEVADNCDVGAVEEENFCPTTLSTDDSKLKICLIVLTEISNAYQLQFQKLWKEWQKTLGLPFNITVYLVAARTENAQLTSSIYFDPSSRLVVFNSFKDSLVPGIVKKTIGILNHDKTQYDWYIRTSSPTFFIPERLLNLLSHLPTKTSPVLAGCYLDDGTFRFIQGRFMAFNDATAQQFKSKASEMFASQNYDDVVLTEIGAHGAEIINLHTSFIYSMRSNNDNYFNHFVWKIRF